MELNHQIRFADPSLFFLGSAPSLTTLAIERCSNKRHKAVINSTGQYLLRFSSLNPSSKEAMKKVMENRELVEAYATIRDLHPTTQ